MICSLQRLSVKDPDIIVSTPVGFQSYLYSIDPDKRGRTDFLRGVKFVVTFNFLYQLVMY